ncbi:MAG: ribosomal L7Ae/L30e/S12e/Gadd45 family protein [Clostridia bacterium]|nr:ribosomal L7Ae/L30e/S12e/Gadd45 family protein [Clostridia bacterium]
MVLEDLRKAKRRSVGTRETTKAVQKGLARAVFVARNAEPHVTEPLLRLCQEKAVEVVMVDDMEELGAACGIDVGSASAAILRD